MLDPDPDEMNADLQLWQWVGYLGAGSEKEAAHAAGLAHAPGGDGRPPGSGSVSQRFGSGSGSGSFPFFAKNLI
jgi:hypothetical protein